MWKGLIWQQTCRLLCFVCVLGAELVLEIVEYMQFEAFSTNT